MILKKVPYLLMLCMNSCQMLPALIWDLEEAEEIVEEVEQRASDRPLPVKPEVKN